MGRSPFLGLSKRCFALNQDNELDRIAVVALGILASLFSIIGLSTCTFIRNTNENVYYDFSDGFGLFAFDVNGKCQNYENNKTEGTHAVSQTFAVVSTIALAAAVGSTILAYRKPIASRWSTIFFCVALLSSMMTMLMFAAPYKHRVCLELGDCRPGLGAGLYIANTLLLPGLMAFSHLRANLLLAEEANRRDIEGQDKTREIAQDVDSDPGDHFSFFSSLSSIKSESPRRPTFSVDTEADNVTGEGSWFHCSCFP